MIDQPSPTVPPPSGNYVPAAEAATSLEVKQFRTQSNPAMIPTSAYAQACRERDALRASEANLVHAISKLLADKEELARQLAETGAAGTPPDVEPFQARYFLEYLAPLLRQHLLRISVEPITEESDSDHQPKHRCL
jgi:hypothetical protein